MYFDFQKIDFHVEAQYDKTCVSNYLVRPRCYETFTVVKRLGCSTQLSMKFQLLVKTIINAS